MLTKTMPWSTLDDWSVRIIRKAYTQHCYNITKKMKRSLLILRHLYKINTFAKKMSTARVTLIALIFRPTNIILIILVIPTYLSYLKMSIITLEGDCV